MDHVKNIAHASTNPTRPGVSTLIETNGYY